MIRFFAAFAVSIVMGCGAYGQTTVRVDIDPKHRLNSFDPDEALGGSIDVLSRTDIDKVYSPHIIQESLSAGWGPITYRNNSELRMAAWQWTENGTWSDLEHQSGYFTGSSELREPVRYIHSYALPHRGFSTSGDRPVEGPNLIYWKSNPYLARHFTHESDELHPQWVIVDLKADRTITGVAVNWANPYARKFRIEYWTGNHALDFDRGPKGEWKPVPQGEQSTGQGGTTTLTFPETPVTTRFVRIWMTESSNTCDDHGSADVRNCVGYAIHDIRIDGAGPELEYATSSMDPWHSAADVRGDGSYEHSGFDLFFTSGLTNNLPALIPVTLLYGTPEDAAAQIAYLKKRGYPIRGIEMGEEPDGKHALPEDYGALYIQWADALHKVDPSLKLGGPIFEGVNEDITVWPDAQGRTSWMGRFIAYLKSHGRLDDLAFVSFEHYPFAPCTITWETLYREPQLMKHILQVWRDDGVPASVPLMVTENHLAAQLTGPMTTIFAALWLADNIGSFFEGGGAAFYHSPIQPQPVEKSCLGSATWSNFVADRDYNITGYTSLYFAAHLINQEWAQHRSGMHEMFPSSAAIDDGGGNTLVTSYALHRPDGAWSLMLVNRDRNNPHPVRVSFENGKRTSYFAGAVRMITFGSEQYLWHDEDEASHADPDGPEVGTSLSGGPSATFTLPKASITVLRGRIASRP